MTVLFKDESYQIVGACMAAHRELGCSFLEAVYQGTLEEVFKIKGTPYVREQFLDISYKGKLLNKTYKADFVCYGKVIVELKALATITSVHQSQLINYLKASQVKLGLLVNFGGSSLDSKRVINKALM